MAALSLSGYSVAVGEFSGDDVEGESIKQAVYADAVILDLIVELEVLRCRLTSRANLSDFVAGVPKGEKLHGLVRKPFRKPALGCFYAAFTVSMLIERCSARLYALFQVSVLDGRNLRTLLNYTGEQVSSCRSS